MATYDVYVFCDGCGVPHKAGIRIDINNGPVDKASLGDVYQGQALPLNVAKLLDNTFTCPATGEPFTQRDNNQVFIVPVKA